MDRLAGARLKLARAEEHFSELATDHQRFLDRNPYRALREADTKPSGYLWRIKIMEHPPYEKWATLVGDCVHALRSALDHTAYELVRIKRPKAEFSEFPIFKDRAKWDTDHGKKLPGVAPKVLTVAKWLQPYRREEGADYLWIVHRLDVIDKHRRLHLVNSTLEGSSWGAEGGRVVITDPCLGPFEDGAVVGKFMLIPEGPNMRMYTNFAFGIALGEGEPGEGLPVLRLLEEARLWVGGCISMFERFLGR
jgi:hypothetical protein